MLGRSTNKRTTSDHEGAARQPLLNRSDEDLSAPHDDVLFAVDDEDDDTFEQETTALDRGDSPPPKSGHSVRFSEDVRIIAPPLRSTTQSREAGK